MGDVIQLRGRVPRKWRNDCKSFSGDKLREWVLVTEIGKLLTFELKAELKKLWIFVTGFNKFLSDFPSQFETKNALPRKINFSISVRRRNEETTMIAEENSADFLVVFVRKQSFVGGNARNDDRFSRIFTPFRVFHQKWIVQSETKLKRSKFALKWIRLRKRQTSNVSWLYKSQVKAICN